jgi:hypothetical protein
MSLRALFGGRSNLLFFFQATLEVEIAALHPSKTFGLMRTQCNHGFAKP